MLGLLKLGIMEGYEKRSDIIRDAGDGETGPSGLVRGPGSASQGGEDFGRGEDEGKTSGGGSETRSGRAVADKIPLFAITPGITQQNNNTLFSQPSASPGRTSSDFHGSLPPRHRPRLLAVRRNDRLFLA